MPSRPAQPQPNTNLYRSLQYYQKGVLQPEAWFRVVERDYTQLIAAINWARIFPEQNTDFQLLDIGCGTGRFPTMLQSHLPASIRIQYDYLDPLTLSSGHQPAGASTTIFPQHGWQTTL